MSERAGKPERVDYGLIFLKCHGCKAPTLFRLEIRRWEDSVEFVAKTHCASCEQRDPLKGVMFRRLEPELVEKQRVDSACHEANPRYGGDHHAE